MPKGDKKRKKEVATEISKLEQELKKLENFKAELDTASPDSLVPQQDDVIAAAREQLGQLSVDEAQGGVASSGKKKSKAQRRKVCTCTYT